MSMFRGRPSQCWRRQGFPGRTATIRMCQAKKVMVKNTLLASLFIAWITPTPPSVVKNFELGGSAAVHGKDCIRLTPDAKWKSGSAWAKKSLDLSKPFDLQMDLMFGEKDELGADGIVFVLTPTQRTGWRGEGLGFAGLRNSLGIEFDTYQNWRQNDPAADHLALVANGVVRHMDDGSPLVELPNLEDGQRHPLRIVWAPEQGRLEVFLDGELRATYPAAVVRNVLGANDKVHWGLTAGTGRKSNVQDVCFKK